MKLMLHKTNNFNIFQEIIEYLFVLCVILDFQTPFSKALNTDYHLSEITLILLICLFGVEFVGKKIKRSTINNWMLTFIPYYIVLIFYYFMTRGHYFHKQPFFVKLFFVLPLLSFIFVLYLGENRLQEIFRKYCNLMVVIALISLYFWIFGSQLNIIKPTGKFYAYWGNAYNYPSYYNLYFERQTSLINKHRYLRNMGIFCEGPMYSFCLVIAIASELFLIKGLDNSYYRARSGSKRFSNFFSFKTIILAITLITTLTTTGSIMLLFMLSLLFLINATKSSQLKLFKYLLVAIIFTFAFYFMYKIFASKSISYSWKIRVDDYLSGFQAWKNSPIWGSGFGNMEIIQLYMSSFRKSGLGFSNSIFVVLAEGGILLFSVYFIPILFCIINASRRSIKEIVAFVIIFSVEFVVAIVTYEFLTLMIISLFYSYIIYNMSFNKPIKH